MNQNGTNDFNDYLDEYPKYKKFASNIVAKQIFDYLSELENINLMILASEADKPALSACIAKIENQFGNQTVFDLNDDFTKQAFGAMVKVILEPFGYLPIKQKRVSSNTLSSASVYEKKGNPRLELVLKLDVKKLK